MLAQSFLLLFFFTGALLIHASGTVKVAISFFFCGVSFWFSIFFFLFYMLCIFHRTCPEFSCISLTSCLNMYCSCYYFVIFV
uniref:Secreted peptide n=1 Tax=Rhipicephalus pulchellus TaxID=72859 RepID=L7LZ98_RHIPC